MTTMSAREFNRDTARAKREADRGPVRVTDRGEPAYVLMTYERYVMLTGKGASIVDLLGDARAAEVEFEPVIDRTATTPADLT